MYSRNPRANLPAGHGNNLESDLSKTLGQLTIDPRTEPKFIGGFSNNYPQTPPKDPRPPPPPPSSLQPANGRVHPPRRQSSSEVAFPVPMHVTPPPPVLYEFTPFQMPTPAQGGFEQSLTMKYAQEDIRPPVPPKDFPRKRPSSSSTNNQDVYLQGDPSGLKNTAYKILPSSDTNLPRPVPVSQPCTPAKPGVSLGSILDTPPLEKRKRVSSEPPSPSDEKKDRPEAQCSGQTKAGKRCTRLVKIGPPLAIVHPDAEDVERFCFQHAKDVFSQSGFYLGGEERTEFIKFGDWIPSYLNTETQAALRSEMTKLPSAADVSGYIYTFEIRDESDPDNIHLKVGRAVNLTKRLDQWDKQCGTKQREHIIRGWWPGTVEDSSDTVNGSSLLKGKVVAGAKGAYCHRLERLIHLELGDLVLSQQYIDPAFPKIDNANVKNTGMAIKQKCAECGTTHKEIFTFKKVKKGKLKGKEWESIVQPIVQRWGEYVGKYPQRRASPKNE